MELNYSRHALDQMSERGITDAMVEYVLTVRTWDVPTTRNTRFDALVEGRRMGVVVALEHTPPVVVTVLWYRGSEP
jgi:hypothetical protein